MSADDGHVPSGRKRRHQQDPVVANSIPMGYASAYADPYGRWAGYGYYPHMPFQPLHPPMAPAPGMAPGFFPSTSSSGGLGDRKSIFQFFKRVSTFFSI